MYFATKEVPVTLQDGALIFTTIDPELQTSQVRN